MREDSATDWVGRLLVCVDGRDHGHAGAQEVLQFGRRVERDADGDALRDLGEIARRVVGRQQAEFRAAGRRQALDTAREGETRKVSTLRLTACPGWTRESWVSL